MALDLSRCGDTSGYSDATGARIRAYLGSVKPVCPEHEEMEDFCRGRELVEQLAAAAEASGDDFAQPPGDLSAGDCADIMRFLAGVEPRDPATYGFDPTDHPSHLVGLTMILWAVEREMRKIAEHRCSNVVTFRPRH